MKISLFFLTFVLIVGIVFFSMLIVDGINSNVLKPKISPVKKLVSVKSFIPIAPAVPSCSREGSPPSALGCCKDFAVIGGVCRKFPAKALALKCAGENQKLSSLNLKCCEGLVNVNFVCKRGGLSSLAVPSPAPPPNPLGQCGKFDQPPTLVGCCEGLVKRINKCVYPYDCARHGQRASEHNNKCCGDEVPDANGICSLSRCGEIWQRASDYNGPNSGCCLGYAPDTNGICKKMGCAIEDELVAHYARGCCRGLEPDSGMCRPPCAKENERENSKAAGCCYALEPDEQGICHLIDMAAPVPALPPSPY